MSKVAIYEKFPRSDPRHRLECTCLRRASSRYSYIPLPSDPRPTGEWRLAIDFAVGGLPPLDWVEGLPQQGCIEEHDRNPTRKPALEDGPKGHQRAGESIQCVLLEAEITQREEARDAAVPVEVGPRLDLETQRTDRRRYPAGPGSLRVCLVLMLCGAVALPGDRVALENELAARKEVLLESPPTAEPRTPLELGAELVHDPPVGSDAAVLLFAVLDNPCCRDPATLRPGKFLASLNIGCLVRIELVRAPR